MKAIASAPVFIGTATALITPFTENNTVDYSLLEQILAYQLQNRADALVVGGTTGEAPTLSTAEHCRLLRFTVDFVKGKIPVIAGTGSNDTVHAVKMSQYAERIGADALLLVTPYYNKPSQEGLLLHYSAIADAVALPCILYNIPSRAACSLQPETYRRLSLYSNIVALKEAGEDFTQLTDALFRCEHRLTLYGGNDRLLLPILSLGGKGIISVFSNLYPQIMHDIVTLWLSGKHQAARDLYFAQYPLLSALCTETNPAPIKRAMQLMGFPVGNCRLPLSPLSEEHDAQLKQALKQYLPSKNDFISLG